MVLRLTRSSSASGRMEGSGSPVLHGARGDGGLHLVDQLQVDRLAGLEIELESAWATVI